MEFVTVTPKMAKQWLETMGDNRTIKRHAVDCFARDMRRGKWKVTGDAIKFNPRRQLRDGQNRLHACIKADLPFSTFVAYNVQDEAILVIDTGSKRSPADQIRMAGTKTYATQVASMAKYLFVLKNGTHRQSRFSANEVLEVVENNPGLEESASAAHKVAYIQQSIAGTIHYVATRHLLLPEKADAFVEVFKTGVPSRFECPAHYWREMRIRASRSYEKPMPQAQAFIACCHIWNMFAGDRALNSRIAKGFRFPDAAMIEGLDVSKI